MSVEQAAGYPSYSDIALIPQLFSDELNIKYYAETIIPKITNTKFISSLLKFGDKITIPSRPTITTFNYQKGMTTPTQIPVSTSVSVLVDKAIGWKFAVDSVDAKQSQILLSKEFAFDALKQVAIATETAFFADIYSSAATDNAGTTAGKISGNYNLGDTTTPLAVTKANVVQVVSNAIGVLREQNADNSNNWMVVPAWMWIVLMNSDLKNASITGKPSSLLGQVMDIGGIKIYSSNLLAHETVSSEEAFHVVAGNMDAITWVNQLQETRILDLEGTFAKQYDGLNVYGYKVIKPEGLVHLVCKQG